MSSHYSFHSEDRVFLGHIERALVSLLERSSNLPRQTEAIAALLTGVWNLPFITPGLACAIEYALSDAVIRFEINEESVSFTHGELFHATFRADGGGSHVGSRFGEDPDRILDYHKWLVLLEMFETDLCDGEHFTVELISKPNLESESRWCGLPSWKAQGVDGLENLQS